MPEEKNCNPLQPYRSSATRKNKRRKKKTKRATSFTTPPRNAEKPQAVSLPPETSPISLLPHQPPAQLPQLSATSDGEQLTGSSRRNIKTPSKESAVLLTAIHKTSGSRELSTQARESLRWEGVLADPQAEKKRLELYRANRRQRYISHRDALLKETWDALRQAFPKEDEEKKALTVSDQQAPFLTTD